ncbi:cytochrome c biogenesis protein [Halorientalis sp. IM1011]|uniref:cytochrome c biogenesis protein n=1 Tax=Halorientalis sp. IM1011 TaxID=1932360 RepID=UPI0020A45C0C|nr:cytochrome c biogenesis protein CcsA [Halorientalis sp. IM1011]
MSTLTSTLSRLIRVADWLMWSRVVRWGTLVTGLLSMGLVFGYASDTMYGIEHGANLIAYWHVPMAWVAALALSVTFLGSGLYLRYGGRFWNRLAHSAGEIGFLFATLTLLTGSIWGRVVWNSWWEWTDVRLVTFLIVWFIYAGYLLVYGATDRTSDERYAAVYGVLGFITVPISYLSTRLWTPTFHETTLANPEVSANIDPLTLGVSFVAATLLYGYLMALRMELHELTDRVRTQPHGGDH